MTFPFWLLAALGNGIICANWLAVFHNRLYHDTTHDAQLEVCRISDEEYGKVEFSNENNRLSVLHLKLPSIDHRVSHLFCLILPNGGKWCFCCSSTSQQKDDWKSSGVDWVPMLWIPSRRLPLPPGPCCFRSPSNVKNWKWKATVKWKKEKSKLKSIEVNFYFSFLCLAKNEMSGTWREIDFQFF